MAREHFHLANARKPDHPRAFNTYRFADHKERVIDLLKRVARVSVETIAILAAMRKASGARTA